MSNDYNGSRFQIPPHTKGRVNNLQCQRSSHDGACKTGSSHTCTAADVSLGAETNLSPVRKECITSMHIRFPP